ncbi:MAG: hypothetical protein AAF585_07645 [Verrucomicrobiota bacterium]
MALLETSNPRPTPRAAGTFSTAPTAQPTPANASGQIKVNLAGNVGGWRLRGDTEWQESGARLSGLVPGVYVLEFRKLAGYDAPLRRQVQIPKKQTITIDEAYVANAAFGLETPLPLSGTSFVIRRRITGSAK